MARREIPRIYSFTPDTGYKPRRRIRLGWSIALTLILSVVFTVFANGFAAHGETTDPSDQKPINVVFDSANLFTPEQKEEISLHAKRLLETYGTAIAIEVVPTIGAKDIETWTVDRANERRVGSDKLNNGLFYGIALNDRKFYVAKGDGYASIPDYKLQSILDEQMVPRFRESNYAQGIIDSSESFGQLVVSPDASKDTRSEEQAAAGKRAGEIAGTVGIWLLGIIVAAGVGIGSYFTVRAIRDRKIEREEAERRAEQRRIEEEKRRIAEAERKKRTAAINEIPGDDWDQFADLPNGTKRYQWLMERNVFARAFDLSPGEKPNGDQISMLNKTISGLFFGAIPFSTSKSIRTAAVDYEREQEQLRIARAEAEKKRREEESVRDKAKQFWRGMSNREKSEFSRLRSEQDRQRWIFDHGGSNVFGLHPAIAVAMFLSLSNDHTRSEARAAEQARSSSTDYSSSSYTDYSSSNMFGGGSFDSGGGAGGSW